MRLLLILLLMLFVVQKSMVRIELDYEKELQQLHVKVCGKPFFRSAVILLGKESIIKFLSNQVPENGLLKIDMPCPEKGTISYKVELKDGTVINSKRNYVDLSKHGTFFEIVDAR